MYSGFLENRIGTEKIPTGRLHHPQEAAGLLQVVLIWDRLLAHRARIVQAYIAHKKNWRSEYLPPYAPELNPVENVWNYLKTNSMANEALYDLETLTKTARRHGRSLQRRQPLLRSFMKHTPLFLHLH